jgi:tRNA-splicing ligase RtcB
MQNYEVMYVDGGLVKSWTRGVIFESKAREQVQNVARLPFIHRHVAIMPDVHWGLGATIGSVIPTRGAVIPAAVGVDIGCGMMAVKTSLTADRLPDNLLTIRHAIEEAVPHGRTHFRSANDKGSWHVPPAEVTHAWKHLSQRFERLSAKHPVLIKTNNLMHLGTLGTGNHFIEVCLDETDAVWVMLHSGSRGVGNKIGTHFIEMAKKDMRRWIANLPDKNLAYFTEGTEHFEDYIEAVEWAQEFALENRKIMMHRTLEAMAEHLPGFSIVGEVVNCHHNYVAREHHFGADIWVTRKGAVRAQEGDIGIIPGSMGARSYIVRGLGNRDSFSSCSHGAGRAMSRREALRKVTLQEHIEAMKGIECRLDADVVDETPRAYKDIDAVMAAQSDLAQVVHTLNQVVCVKG